MLPYIDVPPSTIHQVRLRSPSTIFANTVVLKHQWVKVMDQTLPYCLSEDLSNNFIDNSNSSTKNDVESSKGDSEAAEVARVFQNHLRLLRQESNQQELQELTASPVFTMTALEYAESLLADDSQRAFHQYGLLSGITDLLLHQHPRDSITLPMAEDPRIFFNVSAPSSTFICGSQGSGKSHTLSCLLENCLIPSEASHLPKPLTGLLFHYDTFISDHGGSPCEAAYLSSDPNISVRILCSPTNLRTIQVNSHQSHCFMWFWVWNLRSVPMVPWMSK